MIGCGANWVGVLQSGVFSSPPWIGPAPVTATVAGMPAPCMLGGLMRGDCWRGAAVAAPVVAGVLCPYGPSEWSLFCWSAMMLPFFAIKAEGFLY